MDSGKITNVYGLIKTPSKISTISRNLVHLRKLVLDGCHLREIPARAFWGLPKLRSLTITTRNAGVLKVG